MAPDRPVRIGRYEILDELGRGSMGRAYLARDPTIDRRVAVKVLDPMPGLRVEDENELRQRFVLEARAAGKVSHSGIVMVYDAQTDAASGDSYIAMEWVDGVSLERRLQEGGPLPVADAVTTVADVAEALDAAHRAGLVHRDVKPANLLLDRQGRVKISDFGIAKLASQSQTVAGRILGSPFYMSPEQVRSEPVDGRSDLFALGVVLYQAVTGIVPFGGESLAGITYKILEIDPRPVRSINPQVPASLAAVIERALEKAPADRFQSGLEMATALRAVGRELAGEAVSGTVILEPPPRRPARAWMVVGGVAALAVVALLVAPGRLLESPGTQRPAIPPAAAQSPIPRFGAGDGVVAAASATVTPPPQPPADEPAEETAAAGAAPAMPSPAPAASRSESPPAAKSSRRPAVLEVSYANRLRSGVMTLTVDDRRVWSRNLGPPKGVVEWTLGDTVQARLELSRGKHVVGVTIEGSEGTVHASKRIWGTFEAGRVAHLRVVLLPPTVLRLSWRD